MSKLFDVVSVCFDPPHRIHLMGEKLNEKNAEAVISMAVARRGVDSHFYTTVPAGKYRDGDPYIFPHA